MHVHQGRRGLWRLCWRYAAATPVLPEFRRLTSYTALSALVDVIIAVYPAVVLFQMPMSLRRRIGLTASLGIGSV